MKLFLFVTVLLATVSISRSTLAQAPTSQPAILNNVGVDQKLGNQLPLDATFRDEQGNERPLRGFIGGKPVLLTFVYYECPMLCTLTLNQLNRSLNALTESAGESFDIVTISFDPRETPKLAAAKKKTYLRSYRRPSAEQGWHFLTGTEASIEAVTKAAGFRYTYDEANKLYAHASAVLVVSPAGKITQYFLGTDYPPTDVRAALKLAAAGTVGHPTEQILFYCFKYDPATGKYGLIISRGLKLLGGLTVLALAGLIVSLNFARARRMKELGTAHLGGDEATPSGSRRDT